LRKIWAYRRRRHFRKAGVAMVHVPRSAGTSLSTMLYGTMLGHFTVQDLLSVSAADVLALPRFTVVRNPWSRAVSAWSFARNGGGLMEPGLPRVPIRQPELYRIPAFASFNSFVNEWLAAKHLESLDVVFRQQSDYVLDQEGTLAFDHVGRFENLADTISWLSDRLGRDFALPHTNHGNAGGYRQHYTPQLRQLVAEIYAQDVELLGYDF
jgi:chondroitin 4-sulfotransferase 11